MTMTTQSPSCPESLAANVGFDLLGGGAWGRCGEGHQCRDEGRAVSPGGGDALAIFRRTLAASIRDIDEDDRGRLFQRFLRDGSYEREGPIPPELRGNPVLAAFWGVVTKIPNVRCDAIGSAN